MKNLIITLILFLASIFLWLKSVMLQEKDLTIPIIATSMQIVWFFYILYGYYRQSDE